MIDDLLTVMTEPVGERRAAVLLRQHIVCGATLLVEAEAELCLIDAAGRPRRPPAAVSAALMADPGAGRSGRLASAGTTG